MWIVANIWILQTLFEVWILHTVFKVWHFRDTTLTMVMHNRGPTVEPILLQLLATSDLVRRSIAHTVGYSHENGVTIIDAFGEKLVFPPTIMALFSVSEPDAASSF